MRSSLFASLLILSLLVTVQAQAWHFGSNETAEKWSTIVAAKEVHLVQDLSVEDQRIFETSANFTVKSYSHGSKNGSAGTLKVKAAVCKEAPKETELFLSRPEQDKDEEDRSVGIVVKSGCELWIYVEEKDLEAVSMFAS